MHIVHLELLLLPKMYVFLVDQVWFGMVKAVLLNVLKDNFLIKPIICVYVPQAYFGPEVNVLYALKEEFLINLLKPANVPLTKGGMDMDVYKESDAQMANNGISSNINVNAQI